MPTPPSLSLIMQIGIRCNEWGFCEPKPSVALEDPDYMNAQSEWEGMSDDLRDRVLVAEIENLPDMITQYPDDPPWTHWLELASDQHFMFQVFCKVEHDFDEWSNANVDMRVQKINTCYNQSAIFRAYGGGIRTMTTFQSRFRNFGNTRGIISVLQMIDKYRTDHQSLNIFESDHYVWNGTALLQMIEDGKVEMFKDEL